MSRADVWMPLFIGDHLRACQLLSHEQSHMFLLIQIAYWSQGPLPDDDRELAKVANVGLKKWRLSRSKILANFEVLDGVIRHPQLDREREKSQKRRELARKNGSKGGRPKDNPAGNPSGNPTGYENKTPSVTPSPSQSYPRGTPTPEESEEVTKELLREAKIAFGGES